MLDTETILKDLEATKDLASKLANEILASSGDYALLFSGVMGAGKTTFIRELGQALGINTNITSPTFIGLNEYHIQDLTLYHFDLYQVPMDTGELSRVMEQDTRKIIAIEWADKLDDNSLRLLKQDLQLVNIELETLADDTRRMVIH